MIQDDIVDLDIVVGRGNEPDIFALIGIQGQLELVGLLHTILVIVVPHINTLARRYLYISIFSFLFLSRSQLKQEGGHQETLFEITVVLEPAQHAFALTRPGNRHIIGRQLAVGAGENDLVVFELVDTSF